MRNFFITVLCCLSSLLTAEKAPDFQGITHWINSKPIHIEELRGKVVLVDFWDYSCINCIRTLPHISSWYQKYNDKGFTVTGIHTPEFAFEHSLENVEKAIKRFGILYPVALDNDYKTWRAYDNHYWPTSYLIDKEGNIVLKHIGEGNYLELENAIRRLLNMPELEKATEDLLKSARTPELYLGSERASHYSEEITLVPNSAHAYSYTKPLKVDTVGISGLWRVGRESITSAGSNCSLEVRFTGSKVHIVLSGESKEPLTVTLDGKYRATIFMDGDRTYDIASVQNPEVPHTVKITFPPGISAYSLTFS
ncbi:MAG: thioredoxin family protein [Verrucomicrobia bacterium]|nr:thioredoxin family protein [Verrucomicrobiota bacterium]MBS0637269.1 thioredoxin family protein [Verrucomicrobiota bacterium]